jgi:hypothetical protein
MRKVSRSKASGKFGVIDFAAGLGWIKNYSSITRCHKCSSLLVFGARVLYSRSNRQTHCEPCGEQINAELVKQRVEKALTLEPTIKARREAYDRDRRRQSPFIWTREEMRALDV